MPIQLYITNIILTQVWLVRVTVNKRVIVLVKHVHDILTFLTEKQAVALSPMTDYKTNEYSTGDNLFTHCNDNIQYFLDTTIICTFFLIVTKSIKLHANILGHFFLNAMLNCIKIWTVSSWLCNAHCDFHAFCKWC